MLFLLFGFLVLCLIFPFGRFTQVEFFPDGFGGHSKGDIFGEDTATNDRNSPRDAGMFGNIFDIVNFGAEVCL
jgi:hypothetical protein